MEQKGIGGFGFLRVLVLQWNSHPCFLMYALSKSKSNSKHFKSWRMAPKYTKWKIYLLYKTFTFWEKTKTCPEQPHRASGSFMKVLCKMTPCLKHPLLSGPKSGCLIPVWLYLEKIWSKRYNQKYMFSIIICL